jgi:tripartite-type tricarboxylate transporter receptor subunit TctC
MTDIMGGQVDMGFLAVATATPHIQAGKLRAIGVSSTTRSFVLPEVPTLAEAGLPNFNLDSWVAVVAPGDLPKEVVAKLHRTFETVVASPEVKKQFAALGVVPRITTPEATRAFFQQELELYAAIIKQAGIQAD